MFLPQGKSIVLNRHRITAAGAVVVALAFAAPVAAANASTAQAFPPPLQIPGIVNMGPTGPMGPLGPHGPLGANGQVPTGWDAWNLGPSGPLGPGGQLGGGG
jgi:hypothetical protein